MLKVLVCALALLACASLAHAGPGDAASDSVYMIGEFVDPVCIYQHGMQGVLQRKCAMVTGRVEQGMFFLDIRQRRLYAVIGQTHWEDPRAGFLEALGDTFAVRGKVWRRMHGAAIAITEVHPWREQPQPVYRAWPWHWEWTVLLGCGLIALLYSLCVSVWRRRLGGGEIPFSRGRALVFALSLVTVIGSLNGPMHDLSDLYLFSTHMVQHLILAQLFPLLFVLGIPTWLWSGLLAPAPARFAWRWLAGVPMGFVLYTVVFSIWHVPLLYNLMMRDHNFHVVMHLLVMGTAVLMWWPIAGGKAVEKPLNPALQMVYLFLLGTPMMGVAALITFAQNPLYEWYALAPRFMGMSAVEDQRLGGLLMWVPGTLFYWMVLTVVYFRWARQERREGDATWIGPMPQRG
jgi:putative membrane protein